MGKVEASSRGTHMDPETRTLLQTSAWGDMGVCEIRSPNKDPK